MPSSDALQALDRQHIWHPFTQHQTQPDAIVIERGQGSELIAPDGQRYLDLISSWWVNLHGHGHPHIAQAIAEQAAKLEQLIFAGFTHPPAITLAQRLSQRLPGELSRVFFSDDGSTAVEVALKIAVQRRRNQGRSSGRLLSLEGGYHGDTVGAMSVGAASGFFDAFDSLLFPVDAIPFPATWDDDEHTHQKEHTALSRLDQLLEQHPGEYAALIAEPLIQGAAGMRMARPAFYQALAERCQAHDILLILDEIMTGFGRTGDWFACNKIGIVPDLICLSKGLTGGNLPMSVTVCSDALFDQFKGEAFDQALAHGHSFTANPIACAAANASMDLLEHPDAWANIKRISASHARFAKRLRDHPKARHIRQTGTILALELRSNDSAYGSDTAARMKAWFIDQGLLIRPLGNVLYLLPPYCTSNAQLQRGYQAIEQALELF